MDIYSSAQLAEAIKTMYPMSEWVLQRYYPKARYFETESVVFDEKAGTGKMAPFVSPCVNGKPVVGSGFVSREVKPSYIKLADTLTPCDFVKRQFGEEICARNTMADRLNNARNNMIDEHIMAYKRRLKWMAWQDLLYGKYTIQGDSVPTALIDFQRDPLLTGALTGANLWSASTAQPVADIETMSLDIKNKGRVTATDLLFSPDAFDAWRKLPEIAKWYENCCNRVGATDGTGIPNVMPAAAEEVQFRGQWGVYNVFVVHDTYEDDNGVVTKYFPDKNVLLATPGKGMRLYGGIMNMKAITERRNVAEYYAYEFPCEDGSAVKQGFEASPLVATPHRNTAKRLQVLA